MRFDVSATALVALASIADVAAFVSMANSVSHSIHQTSLAAHISTSEDSPRNLQDLEEWCTQYGVQKMNGVQLYSEDFLDWQLITTEDIPAGTALLYVPAEMVLSSFRVAQEFDSMGDVSVAKAVEKLGKIGGAGSIPKFHLFLKGAYALCNAKYNIFALNHPQ